MQVVEEQKTARTNYQGWYKAIDPDGYNLMENMNVMVPEAREQGGIIDGTRILKYPKVKVIECEVSDMGTLL